MKTLMAQGSAALGLWCWFGLTASEPWEMSAIRLGVGMLGMLVATACLPE